MSVDDDFVLELSYQFRDLMKRGNYLLSVGKISEGAEVFKLIERYMNSFIYEHHNEVIKNLEL